VGEEIPAFAGIEMLKPIINAVELLMIFCLFKCPARVLKK
jgi:hypothetical protein